MLQRWLVGLRLRELSKAKADTWGLGHLSHLAEGWESPLGEGC